MPDTNPTEENNNTSLNKWLIGSIAALTGVSGALISIIYTGVDSGINQNRIEINQVKAQITDLNISTEKGFHDIVIAMKDNNSALLQNINDFQKQTMMTTVKNESDIKYLKENAKE